MGIALSALTGGLFGGGKTKNTNPNPVVEPVNVTKTSDALAASPAPINDNPLKRVSESSKKVLLDTSTSGRKQFLGQ